MQERTIQQYGLLQARGLFSTKNDVIELMRKPCQHKFLYPRAAHTHRSFRYIHAFDIGMVLNGSMAKKSATYLWYNNRLKKHMILDFKK